ncbi:MAG: hypothetical protein EOO39_39125 [Cytophagaceae bacterium]|nr:MAG: hypothetical protein EOO39_39125 [Cytophagaceae bacterium]
MRPPDMADKQDPFVTLSASGFRASILLLLAALIFSLDVQTVYAQSTQCMQLDNALRQFDRNGDFV